MPFFSPKSHRLIRGKFNYSLQKRQPITADTSISPGSEVLELVWENGQVLMQGPVSGGRKDKSSKPRRRDVGFGKSVAAGDAQARVPSAEMAFSHEDDLFPWLNCPIRNDHCSELLPEPSGVIANNRNSAPVDRIHRRTQMVLDRSCANPSFCSSSSQLLSDHVLHLQPKASDCSNALPVTSSSLDSDQILPSNTSALMNFSHFSRPAALAKAHFHKHSMIGCLSEKDKTRGSHAVPSIAAIPVPKLKPLGKDDKQADAVCRSKLSKNEETHKQRVGENASRRSANVEKTKTLPPSVAASVCSANAGERTPGRQVPSAKRKCQEAEESEFHSEDMEDCFEVEKVVGRRNRVAEVHNLSERRRRDRINEKMRALQELIPNCNKVDKASMLDEAIDYLKTLQFQVQFMSMGAGMYMPSMMLPFGFQQNLSCMAHFPQPGGGIGMLEMNGSGGSDWPMFPTQASHFPAMGGGAAVHGMAGSNLQPFGLPAPGIPMFTPPVPLPISLPVESGVNAGSEDQMATSDKQNPGVS